MCRKFYKLKIQCEHCLNTTSFFVDKFRIGRFRSASLKCLIIGNENFLSLSFLIILTPKAINALIFKSHPNRIDGNVSS